MHSFGVHLSKLLCLPTICMHVHLVCPVGMAARRRQSHTAAGCAETRSTTLVQPEHSFDLSFSGERVPLACCIQRHEAHIRPNPTHRRHPYPPCPRTRSRHHGAACRAARLLLTSATSPSPGRLLRVTWPRPPSRPPISSVDFVIRPASSSGLIGRSRQRPPVSSLGLVPRSRSDPNHLVNAIW